VCFISPNAQWSIGRGAEHARILGYLKSSSVAFRFTGGPVASAAAPRRGPQRRRGPARAALSSNVAACSGNIYAAKRLVLPRESLSSHSVASQQGWPPALAVSSQPASWPIHQPTSRGRRSIVLRMSLRQRFRHGLKVSSFAVRASLRRATSCGLSANWIFRPRYSVLSHIVNQKSRPCVGGSCKAPQREGEQTALRQHNVKKIPRDAVSNTHTHTYSPIIPVPSRCHPFQRKWGCCRCCRLLLHAGSEGVRALHRVALPYTEENIVFHKYDTSAERRHRVACGGEKH